MIIVEGMDNSGKTTLINHLATHFNLPTVKSYKPRLRSDIYALHSWCSAAPQTVITDRHPAISDLVYGPIIRGSTPSSLAVARGCIVNNFLIYCRPPDDRIFLFKDRTQMAGIIEQAIGLLEAYDALMMDLLPQSVFDYTEPNALQNLTRKLQSELF